MRFRRTVHGPVIGYARVAGTKRVVALARSARAPAARRPTSSSSSGSRTAASKSARDFIRAAAATPQTFNAFYADEKDIAFVTTGRLPVRPQGRQRRPARPTAAAASSGRASSAANGTRRTINPSSGLLVNWNNKPARDFPAGDDRWDEGGMQRVDWLLQGAGARPRSTRPRPCSAPRTPRATADPRGADVAGGHGGARQGHGAEPARAGGRRPDHAWSAGDASWVDANGDGMIDAPGQAAMAAVWDELAGAALCGRLGDCAVHGARDAPVALRAPARAACTAAGTSTWARTCARCSAAACAGPLRRALLRQRATSARCARDLWAAIERGRAGRGGAPGHDRPARSGSAPTVKISFTPLPLVDMQYTNRPSGIHQVDAVRAVSRRGRRPRRARFRTRAGTGRPGAGRPSG